MSDERNAREEDEAEKRAEPEARGGSGTGTAISNEVCIRMLACHHGTVYCMQCNALGLIVKTFSILMCAKMCAKMCVSLAILAHILAHSQITDHTLSVLPRAALDVHKTDTA